MCSSSPANNPFLSPQSHALVLQKNPQLVASRQRMYVRGHYIYGVGRGRTACGPRRLVDCVVPRARVGERVFAMGVLLELDAFKRLRRLRGIVIKCCRISNTIPRLPQHKIRRQYPQASHGEHVPCRNRNTFLRSPDRRSS